ncbi:sensor histidine kinase [Clostridium butyricum]|uniref:histidine kinase n=3 Tax=Clostridium butyricum TaxID=1492 RepID=A0A2S7F5D6_CLOBU|nr:hypothetical protein OA81_14245 [Clostridium butyricum]PPV12092.1 hypothetical protein AWN73_06040 [Clostridium butyricum]
MKFDIILYIIILILCTAFIISVNKYMRIHKHINEITDVLKEVLKGNNNLHLFSYNGDKTAKLSLLINQLMDSYQKERITVNREQMARKQLLANISHDVRTPLASVIGYLEAVILGVVHNTEKDVYLDIALKKSYDLKQRVELLFELVRLDANEIHFNREKSDICELVRSVIIDFIPIVEKNDIILQVKIPDKEYFADVDVSAFTRVVQNLIRNAITHGKSGFYLGVKVYLQGKNVCIDVIDHGDGISKKDITFIFDRLYQGDTSRTQNGGLGLAIAYEIVKKMGGTINVDSKESKYTVFTVQLPLLE